MKLKQLIIGGALAATVLTLGSAQAENNYDGIVFCKATIVGGAEESSVSITLPFTTTGVDGQQYTHWNLGKVVAGGVADSWHSEGGPGKFTAHNSGNVGAYVYLTSALGYNTYCVDWCQDSSGLQGERGIDLKGAFEGVFSTDEIYLIEPATSLAAWQRRDYVYCLAYTRDMDAKYPTWHMLNRECRYTSGSNGHYVWEENANAEQNVNYIGTYMGYLAAGDYMPFDVKFWAPRMMWLGSGQTESVYFSFKVEAASFPLWEHDRDVQ